MTVLEATIEIVKATMGENASHAHYLSDNDSRERLIKGIEEIYNKLKSLETLD